MNCCISGMMQYAAMPVTCMTACEVWRLLFLQCVHLPAYCTFCFAQKEFGYKANVHYYRVQGGVGSDRRQHHINDFNTKKHARVWLACNPDQLITPLCAPA